MVNKKSRYQVRHKKHWRMRHTLSGTAERPRMSVFRSNKHMYVQFVDDKAGHTLCAASTLEKEVKESLAHTDDVEAAKKLGEVAGKRALEKGIESVVFDRGGYLYAGKVAALADAAREAGLKF